jgi:hypothetical protein
MASKKTGKEPIRDNTLFWSDLNFLPSTDKNELWCAQALFYSKQNSVQFLDSKRMREYRKLEKGEINERVYKEMIDPKTPKGDGGTAEYFAADWKTCPIDSHIDNIVRAKLDKVGVENKLQVAEIDKFAKTQKQRDREKILYQREVRLLINEVHKELGYPPLKESENPYSYIKSKSGKGGPDLANGGEQLLDYIKSQIKDSQDLALYETYIYKGDIELAFELGIQHYLINLNKWHIKAESFNNDIKHFNKFSGRLYTDETTGRPNVEYLVPDRLFTSPFTQKNGEDIQMWHYEYDVTFADFVRMFATTMTDEKLKEVFELNKSQGGNHGMSWSIAGTFKGSNANIRIGIFSVLTQDADNFSSKYVNNRVPTWQRKPLSWLPDKHTPNKYKSEQEQRIYNVWYSCYYVPPPGDRLANNQPIDWEWQSQFIFNLHKDIDAYRYGPDVRYAKSTLVIWKDETRMSFTDVKEAFMPKIRTTWHKFQNCLIQDTTALAISRDLLGALLKSVDEANNTDPGDPDNPTGGNGMDASVQSMRMLKQGGMAFLDFRDKQGNLILDPSKLFVPIDTKHLDKGERFLKIIMEQYNMMTMALAQSDLATGEDVKPRVPAAGIQASLNAGREGMWFMEKPVRECLIMFGERTVQFLLYMVQEKKTYGYAQRFDEFSQVVGLANTMLLESVEDLKPEEIGLTVSLEDIRANQQYVIELANKMADDGEVGREVVGMVMNQVTINYKYAYVLLMVAAKRRQEEIAHQEDLKHQREMELENKKLQTAQTLLGFKTQGKVAEIDEKGKIQMMINEALGKIKHRAMTDQKAQLLENKKEQDKNKAELQEQGKVQDAMAGT